MMSTQMDYKKLKIVFKNMRKRCNNKKDTSYEYYGGRGISVCEEWESFSAFVEWAINSGYQEGLSIDRIDNDGNYSPDNCRFTTKSISSQNTRMYRTNKYGYRGVYFYKGSNKFRAQIQINGQKKHLGLYSNPIDAAVAYDSAVISNKTAHGLNFTQPITNISKGAKS